MALKNVHPKLKSTAHFSFKQLVVHDIIIHGMKACVYCFGLSASRYIEYINGLRFLLEETNPQGTLLEIGCGHSLLPTFWLRMGVNVIMIDTSREALRWQMKKSKTFKNIAEAVLADVRYLPFACGSVSGASCISALEHVPADGDIKAAIEIGRVLKPKSVWVVSVPLSTDRSGYCKKHWAAEIPSLIQRLFGVCLPIIMRTLNVDRTSSYFERFFSEADVVERIIKPSDCRQEEFATLRSGSFVTSLYRKVIPTGVFTILDYVMAKMLVLNDKIESGHAVILKLRKQ